MAFLFRKRKKTGTTETVESNDKILRQMVNTCLRLQTGWALWMGRRTERLSRKTLFLLLLTFTALAGGYCIYLIGQSFMGNQANAISITPIRKPGHVLQAGDVASQPDMIVSKTDYQGIIRFRGYMDSLTRSPAGKAAYDSIVLSRPGLLDSIRFIEEIYQSQTKK
jgi:hypothetical protein